MVFGSTLTGLIGGAGGGFILLHSPTISLARADELTGLQIIIAVIVMHIAMITNLLAIDSSQVAWAFVRRQSTPTLKIAARCETEAHSILVPPYCVTGGIRTADYATRGDACAVI